jgi:hypothetical protein
MLRVTLRDPRVSKAVQVAFVAMSALWLVNFSTQETHSTFSWVLLPLNIAVLVGFFVLAVARLREVQRLDARNRLQWSSFAANLNAKKARPPATTRAIQLAHSV